MAKNGAYIQYYTITVYTYDPGANPNSDLDDSLIVVQPTVRLPNTATSFTLTGLAPCGVYWVDFAACNDSLRYPNKKCGTVRLGPYVMNVCPPTFVDGVVNRGCYIDDSCYGCYYGDYRTVTLRWTWNQVFAKKEVSVTQTGPDGKTTTTTEWQPVLSPDCFKRYEIQYREHDALIDSTVKIIDPNAKNEEEGSLEDEEDIDIWENYWDNYGKNVTPVSTPDNPDSPDTPEPPVELISVDPKPEELVGLVRMPIYLRKEAIGAVKASWCIKSSEGSYVSGYWNYEYVKSGSDVITEWKCEVDSVTRWEKDSYDENLNEGVWFRWDKNEDGVWVKSETTGTLVLYRETILYDDVLGTVDNIDYGMTPYPRTRLICEYVPEFDENGVPDHTPIWNINTKIIRKLPDDASGVIAVDDELQVWIGWYPDNISTNRWLLTKWRLWSLVTDSDNAENNAENYGRPRKERDWIEVSNANSYPNSTCILVADHSMTRLENMMTTSFIVGDPVYSDNSCIREEVTYDFRIRAITCPEYPLHNKTDVIDTEIEFAGDWSEIACYRTVNVQNLTDLFELGVDDVVACEAIVPYITWPRAYDHEYYINGSADPIVIDSWQTPSDGWVYGVLASSFGQILGRSAPTGHCSVEGYQSLSMRIRPKRTSPVEVRGEEVSTKRVDFIYGFCPDQEVTIDRAILSNDVPLSYVDIEGSRYYYIDESAKPSDMSSDEFNNWRYVGKLDLGASGIHWTWNYVTSSASPLDAFPITNPDGSSSQITARHWFGAGIVPVMAKTYYGRKGPEGPMNRYTLEAWKPFIRFGSGSDPESQWSLMEAVSGSLVDDWSCRFNVALLGINYKDSSKPVAELEIKDRVVLDVFNRDLHIVYSYPDILLDECGWVVDEYGNKIWGKNKPPTTRSVTVAPLADYRHLTSYWPSWYVCSGRPCTPWPFAPGPFDAYQIVLWVSSSDAFTKPAVVRQNGIDMIVYQPAAPDPNSYYIEGRGIGSNYLLPFDRDAGLSKENVELQVTIPTCTVKFKMGIMDPPDELTLYLGWNNDGVSGEWAESFDVLSDQTYENIVAFRFKADSDPTNKSKYWSEGQNYHHVSPSWPEIFQYSETNNNPIVVNIYCLLGSASRILYGSVTKKQWYYGQWCGVEMSVEFETGLGLNNRSCFYRWYAGPVGDFDMRYRNTFHPYGSSGRVFYDFVEHVLGVTEFNNQVGLIADGLVSLLNKHCFCDAAGGADGSLASSQKLSDLGDAILYTEGFYKSILLWHDKTRLVLSKSGSGRYDELDIAGRAFDTGREPPDEGSHTLAWSAISDNPDCPITFKINNLYASISDQDQKQQQNNMFFAGDSEYRMPCSDPANLVCGNDCTDIYFLGFPHRDGAGSWGRGQYEWESCVCDPSRLGPFSSVHTAEPMAAVKLVITIDGSTRTYSRYKDSTRCGGYVYIPSGKTVVGSPYPDGWFTAYYDKGDYPNIPVSWGPPVDGCLVKKMDTEYSGYACDHVFPVPEDGQYLEIGFSDVEEPCSALFWTATAYVYPRKRHYVRDFGPATATLTLGDLKIDFDLSGVGPSTCDPLVQDPDDDWFTNYGSNPVSSHYVYSWEFEVTANVAGLETEIPYNFRNKIEVDCCAVMVSKQPEVETLDELVADVSVTDPEDD